MNNTETNEAVAWPFKWNTEEPIQITKEDFVESDDSTNFLVTCSLEYEISGPEEGCGGQGQQREIVGVATTLVEAKRLIAEHHFNLIVENNQDPLGVELHLMKSGDGDSYFLTLTGRNPDGRTYSNTFTWKISEVPINTLLENIEL